MSVNTHYKLSIFFLTIDITVKIKQTIKALICKAYFLRLKAKMKNMKFESFGRPAYQRPWHQG